MRVILLMACLIAAPAMAEIRPVSPPAAEMRTWPVAAPSAGLVRVTLTTADGSIVMVLDTANAPITSANFLRYVASRRLDGTAFYRAMRMGEGAGLVQFGTRNDPKRTFPGIAHEPTTRTGLTHTDGAIAMAMAKPGTAAGDVFIVVGDLHMLDATNTDAGFAVFGRVIEGMAVVRRIMMAPTSPTEGEGAMKGQMLTPPITITTARRDGSVR